MALAARCPTRVNLERSVFRRSNPSGSGKSESRISSCGWHFRQAAH